MQDEHVWVFARLPAFDLEILDAGAAARVVRHLGECTTCRAALVDYRAQKVAPGVLAGHIPNAVLARWQVAQHRLVGAERSAAVRHLAGCEECRGKLEALGFTD